MILDKTFATIKNSPIGFVGGALAGYYIAEKYIKTEKLWQKLAVTFVAGIVGTGLEHYLTSKRGLAKTEAEIKGK